MYRPIRPRLPHLSQRGWEIAAVLVLLAVALGIILTRHMPAQPQRCPHSNELVPSCGALLGIAAPTPNVASLAAVEKALRHRFALVYSFHDINDAVPSPYDRAIVASGATLHISIDARVYGEPAGAVTWSAIAAGSYDDALTRDAEGIASLHRRVFLTFDHEPDQPVKAVQGSPADFVAAWRHVHEVFAHTGATNVVWVWVVTGWAGSAQTALRMWPGNAYVDWISWEAYDNQGCVGATHTAPIGFAQAALPFGRWLHRHAAQVGMDLSKPIMISEAGTALIPGRPANPNWFPQMEQVLRKHPRIKAIAWWDHRGSAPGCDYTFSEDPTLVRTAARVASRPWFNH